MLHVQLNVSKIKQGLVVDEELIDIQVARIANIPESKVTSDVSEKVKDLDSNIKQKTVLDKTM